MSGCHISMPEQQAADASWAVHATAQARILGIGGGPTSPCAGRASRCLAHRMPSWSGGSIRTPISMDVRARPVQHCRPPVSSPFGSSQVKCQSLLDFSLPEADDPAAAQPQSTSDECKLLAREQDDSKRPVYISLFRLLKLCGRQGTGTILEPAQS